MKNKDYDYYGMLTNNELLRKKKAPNVFIYQQLTDECGIYEVRVGGGWDERNLPAFKIPFTIPEGDFVMVKYAAQKPHTKLSPTSPPKNEEVKQTEMTL